MRCESGTFLSAPKSSRRPLLAKRAMAYHLDSYARNKMSGSDETRLAVAASFIVRDFMCVKPGEQLVITADSASDSRAVQALLEAAKVAKARAAVLTIPQLPFQGALADPYVAEPLGAAVKSCDVWLDI